MKKDGSLFSASNSESDWDESEHPRDKKGKFTYKGEQGSPSATKMTPAEKIASVHIDFDRDNILPELNEETVEKLGVESKPVLLKGTTIKRNLQRHVNVSDEVMEDIITEALYRPIDVFPANLNNPNYFHLAAFIEVKESDGLKMGLVLLDVDAKKENLEIGHAYFVRSDGFERAKNKTQRKN